MSNEFPYADQQAAYQQQSAAQGSYRRRMAEAMDPRKAIDPATVERMIRAQVAARTQAQAATTVVLATIVSLITSAFSFVAALAWNTAIQDVLNETFVHNGKIFGITLSPGGVETIYAIIVTIIAVLVVVILNRVARRYASKSALSGNGS